VGLLLLLVVQQLDLLEHQLQLVGEQLLRELLQELLVEVPAC
jgi:hypothetical protein